MTLRKAAVKLGLLTGLMFGLGACGGSSSVPLTTGVPAFSSNEAARQDGLERLEALGELELTPPSEIRTSGSATFDGSIVLNDDSRASVPTASVIGGMAVNVDFANADNVTGTAGNFFDINNKRVPGTLELSNVIFDQGVSGGGFVGDLDGTLRGVAGAGDYTYDLELGAIYFGDNIVGLLGFVNGTATANGSPRPVSGAAVLE